MKNIRYTYYIDASTTQTGITLVSEDNRVKIVTLKIPSASSKIKEKEKRQVCKLRNIKRILDKLTEEYPPSKTVYLEGIFIQPKFLASSEILLKLHGFLIGYFEEADLEFIPPSVIKKTITGKGNSSKTKVREILEKEYDIQFHNDDESDSFALYETVRLLNGKNRINKIQILDWEKSKEEINEREQSD